MRRWLKATRVHNSSVTIHQVSIHYQVEQDRILMRLRTRDDSLYEIWFTRRMMSRVLQPLQQAVAQLALQTAAGGSTIMPEAQQMMLDSAREKSRQAADFQTPFNEAQAERPLGEEPLLVTSVDLQVQGQSALKFALRDAQNRQLALELDDALAHNIMSLLSAALQQSEWGLMPTGSTVEEMPQPAQTRMLN